MTYHSISKYPTVCVLMTIQMGEIIRFQLVSNLYRLSDCKWRLIGKSIAGFRFIDSANVWLPVTSIQARAKSHVTCAEVRKQDPHTSLSSACSSKVYSFACCKRRRTVEHQTHIPVSPRIQFVFLRIVLPSCAVAKRENKTVEKEIRRNCCNDLCSLHMVL